MKIISIGTGYVGLVSGSCFSETGVDVVCVDVDERKINMLKEGATVVAYDPVAMEECKRIIGNSLSYAKDEYDACIEADALILVTEWVEFRMPNFAIVERLLKSKTIFDGRNIYEPEEMRELKFNYCSAGRKPVLADIQ